MTRLKKAAVYIPVCSLNTLAIKVRSPQFLLQSSIALGNLSLFEQGQRKYTTKLQADSVQTLPPQLSSPTHTKTMASTEPWGQSVIFLVRTDTKATISLSGWLFNSPPHSCGLALAWTRVGWEQKPRVHPHLDSAVKNEASIQVVSYWMTTT